MATILLEVVGGSGFWVASGVWRCFRVWMLGPLSFVGGTVWGVVWILCHRAQALHLPVHEEPATMLLSLERFFQQSWHTIIQPSSLWLAPRVLTPSPPLPQIVHTPNFILSGCVMGWMVNKVLPDDARAPGGRGFPGPQPGYPE
jgi:hypothetical protein